MAQSPTYRKKGFSQQFQRKSEIKEPGVYLIACEGTRDEPRYIQEFVKEMRVRAKVFIAEREAGDYRSNPRQVYDILKVNMEKPTFSTRKESVHGWIMVDRDNDRMEELKEVKEQCDDTGVSIAYSSPCIELWFLLHYTDLSSLNIDDPEKLLISKRMKAYLKDNHFDPAKGFLEILPLTNEAIDRAREIDDPDVDFPEDFCTRVYKLVQELLEFD
jgi:hypothetical protein